MADLELLLTPAVLAEWTAEKERLEALVKRTQEELLRATQKLQAATFLLSTGTALVAASDARHEHISADTGIPIRQITPEAETDGLPNMTEEIEKIANSVDQPISHEDMRGRLRDLHFPESRLGNYYYTAVHRLRAKGRISVNKKKRIGRAPI